MLYSSTRSTKSSVAGPVKRYAFCWRAAARAAALGPAFLRGDSEAAEASRRSGDRSRSALFSAQPPAGAQ